MVALWDDYFFPSPLGDVSKVQYSINGGEWLDYTQPTTLDIDDYPQGASIATKAVPTQLAGAFLESEVTPVEVESREVNLQTPQIAASHTSFHPFERDSITVTVTNPNPQEASGVEVSFNGGAEWVTYTEPINLRWQDYQQGANVMARAIPSVHPQNLFSSDETAVSLEMEPAKLAAPAITASIPSVNEAGQIATNITIFDSNPSEYSTVYYSLDSEETWDVYEGAFTVSFADYPSSQTVVAKSLPTKNADVILPSDTTHLDIDADRPKLQEPLIMFSGELAEVSDLDVGAEPAEMYDAQTHQGYFAGSATVVIDPALTNPEDSAIYYTLDGSEPSASNGTVYTGPFELEYSGRRRELDSHMVKAIALSTTNPSVYLPSDVVASSGTLVDPTEIQYFDGDSDSNFADAIVGSWYTRYEYGDNYFEWGLAPYGFTESYLDFEGTAFSSVTENSFFEIGTLNYNNGTVYYGDVLGVTFNVDINFGSLDFEQSFAFQFELVNTVNYWWKSADQNADYVRLGNMSDDFTVTLDNGKLYELELQFGYIGNNGFTTVDEFHVHEEKGASATLFGRFVEDLDYDGIW